MSTKLPCCVGPVCAASIGEWHREPCENKELKALNMHGPDDNGRTHPDCEECRASVRELQRENERLRRDAREVCTPIIERQGKEIGRLRDEVTRLDYIIEQGPNRVDEAERAGIEMRAWKIRAESAETELIIAKACANGMALDALKALREMTGSQNDDNPWLGITSAVALYVSQDEPPRRRRTREPRDYFDSEAADNA